MRRLALLLVASLPISALGADACLDRSLAPLDANAMSGQMVVSVLHTDRSRDTRVVAPSNADAPLSGNEGFRIASVTKTYVAATALRLYEQGKLDLGAPIIRYLPHAWMQRLAKDGYRPQDITVKQLLSHTSGLADHAQAPQFIAAIQADPSTKWTPATDVAWLVEWTDPVGHPGEKYSYSDTGYILLGAIIEKVTGTTLPQAVRAQLRLDARDLPGTYWERYETAGTRVRAHQYFEGTDTYAWDPSMDLYGGGGIVAPAADMATFFDALLSGKVFARPQTLALMQSADGLPADSPYRLGLLTYDFGGTHVIGHSGFWGTLVVREPHSGATIAGAVTRREEFPKLKELIGRYVQAAAAPDAACTSGG